ncbi:uncharacterized protein LOC133842989 [Drosophila sulfurigaster albostrigata]|uniref:uncharacterized protein LOC133842989 n=1 Tax=Drosophila sulfurigaster albostrigata TaxID=89887 RepID=UPI002D21E25F|nr:uncharacterized protein LOC133842989 [Drosophila sulfurigaster albostrigata]
MNNNRRSKENSNGQLLHCNAMKYRTPVNVLKASQAGLGKEAFKSYVNMWLGDLTADHLGSVLDWHVSEHESSCSSTTASVTGWYTVCISNCRNLTNDSILLAIKYAMLPVPVQMFDFKRIGVHGDCGHFLVDNKLLANRLMRLRDKVIVLYTTQNINIHVQLGISELFSELPLDAPWLQAMRDALRARYDASCSALYLTRFHAAAELKTHFCALHLKPMLQQLLLLIAEEFPQLRVLQLRDNFICSLSAFDTFPRNRLTQLQVLDVSINQIQGLMELKNLRNMPLQTLDITGNPLAKSELQQLRKLLPEVAYIHCNPSVHEMKPKLDNIQRPLAERYCGANSNGRNFCLQFANGYYAMFNGKERREKLEHYYAANAVLTLSLPKLRGSNQQPGAACDKLYYGRKTTVKAICALPELHIDVKAAQFYVYVFTQEKRIFAMSGCHKERTHNSDWQLGNYMRVFVLQPAGAQGNHWSIVRDSLRLRGLIKDNDGSPTTEVLMEKQMESLNNLLPKLNLETEISMTVDDEQMPALVPLKQPASISVERLMPKLVPLKQPEVQPPSISSKAIPQAVSVTMARSTLESELDDTLPLSDDEMLLTINEDDLLDDF